MTSPDNFAETGRYFRELTFKQTGRSEAVAAETKKNMDEVLAGRMTMEEFEKRTVRASTVDYAANRAAKIDKQLREGMQGIGFGWLMEKRRERAACAGEEN